MKKALTLFAVLAFTTTCAFAGSVGNWAQQTTNKINAKEAAIQKQQADAQAKRDAQKAQFEKDRAAREAAQKAKQDAAKKRIETKKQQWNQLINN